MSAQVSHYTGLPASKNINVHTIIGSINFLIALLILTFAYTFNHCYLKFKQSPVILQAERGNSNKNLISFKKLIFVIFIMCLLVGAILILQTCCLDNTQVPKGLILAGLVMTIINWSFSRKTKIRDYFWLKVHQKTVNCPWIIRRTWRAKVQPLPSV